MTSYKVTACIIDTGYLLLREKLDSYYTQEPTSAESSTTQVNKSATSSSQVVCSKKQVSVQSTFYATSETSVDLQKVGDRKD